MLSVCSHWYFQYTSIDIPYIYKHEYLFQWKWYHTVYTVLYFDFFHLRVFAVFPWEEHSFQCTDVKLRFLTNLLLMNLTVHGAATANNVAKNELWFAIPHIRGIFSGKITRIRIAGLEVFYTVIQMCASPNSEWGSLHYTFPIFSWTGFVWCQLANLGMTSQIFISCREICTVVEGRREGAQSSSLVLGQLTRHAGLLARLRLIATLAPPDPAKSPPSHSSLTDSLLTAWWQRTPAFPAGHQQHQACRGWKIPSWVTACSHPPHFTSSLSSFQNELTAEAAALHRPIPQVPQSREVYFL